MSDTEVPSDTGVAVDVRADDAVGTSAPSSPVRAPASRRAALAAGVAAIAMAVLPRRAKAQATRRPRPGPITGTPNIPNEIPVAPQEWASDSNRLLRRITYGITDADVTAAKQYGYRGFLERQLDYTHIDDSVADAFVAAKYPLVSLGTSQLYAANSGMVQNQLNQSTLYRAAFSKRQLYERMVEFWSDHFNIAYSKVTYLKVVDDADVIRKYALTTFPKLLYASAKSGAMMVYLDQNQSRAGSPNQNYAREIMELHTLGVDGGYTQTDVAELSRVLTGWNVVGRGDFAFYPSIHDFGKKVVLGTTIPASSQSVGAGAIVEGEQMLDLLLAHPSTASFIATKMLRWFVTPQPTAQQVAAVAAEYTRTGGDIKAMIRVVLNPAWLAAAPMKLKRPFHLIASSMRTTSPMVNGVAGPTAQLNNTGQPLFMWDTPDGYPDRVDYWAGNVLPRWNYASYYSALAGGEVNLDVTQFMRGNSADQTIAAIDTRLFGGEIDPALRASLTTYIKGATFNAARVRETLALAMSSNTFQWY